MENAKLKEKIESILRRSFRDSDFNWETSDDRLFGVVVTPEFHGLPDRLRQQILWGKLQAELSREELVQVLGILTLTPDEDEDLEEDRHDSRQ